MRRRFFLWFMVLWFAVGVLFARPWWKDAVFYEIFVRSFYDSNGDGIGDLNGVAMKLDYLTNLGVNAIWLMPIQPSPSYHGYDVLDYTSVNPQYGTMEDFEKLIEEAHKRGVKVIIDLVLNHTSSQHMWFLSSAKKDTQYNDFYIWKKDVTENGWGRPWGGGSKWDVWIRNSARGEYYYAAFWGGMPDLNHRSEKVKEEVYKFTKFWLDKGVDGFRLDAIRYLIETGPGTGQADTEETLAWFEDFNRYVKSINSNAVLVGEVWADIKVVSRYYSTNGIMDLCFDFDRAGAFLSGDKDAIIRVYMNQNRYNAPVDFYAPFLANHDHYRAMNQLQNNENYARLAAVCLLTSTGTPFIYYGEEIGLAQPNMPDDKYKRMPLPWNGDSKRNFGFTSGKPWFSMPEKKKNVNIQDQLKNKNSLLSLYRTLVHIRKNNSEFRSDKLEIVPSNNPNILVYKRTDGTYTSWVIINFSSEKEEVFIPVLENKPLLNLLTEKKITLKKGAKISGLDFWILKEN